jgi:HEAT repeat protein
MIRTIHRTLRFVAPLGILFLLLTTACGGGPGGASSRAESVFEQVMESQPDFTAYAINIAADGGSSFARGKVVERVASDHYPTALAAVRALAENPTPESREALRAAFVGKGGALKLQAAVALARLGDEEALDWLRQELAGGGVALGLPAVEVLVESGDIDTVKVPIQQYMDSEDLSTRNEAYAILGALKQPWATEMLIKGLKNERGEDRQQAIIALGQTGDPEVAYEIVGFNNTQGLVFATLESLGNLGEKGTAAAVEEMTTHDESTVRVYAAVATWKLGNGEKALPVLEALATDEDPMIRRLVAEQLQGVADPAARAMLAGLAADADKAVRLAALRSLADGAGDGDVGLFLQAAQDAEYEVSTVALNVLSGLSVAPEGVATIEPLMESDNPYVALSAAHAVLAIEERQSAAGS